MSFGITNNQQTVARSNEDIKAEHRLISDRIATLREQEKTLADRSTEIVLIEKQKAELEFRLKEVRQEVSRLTDDKAKLTREVEIEKSSLDVARHALEMTDKAAVERKKHLKTLEENIRQAQHLIDSVQASAKSLEEKKISTAAELDRLEASLRYALAGHNENIARLQAEIERYTSNLTRLNADIEDKKKELTDSNSRVVAVHQQIDQANKDLADIERQKLATVAQVREECDNLRQSTNKWVEERQREIADKTAWAAKQEQINEEKLAKLVMVKKELEKIHNRPIHIAV
jgi:chromosome segregation ATPase